ncbi:MAG: methyltransferase domain-containing protein [Magnetococcales bacterium]|nr:methyltransferase domain-containing protein [Magnetococcales bacterium]MBF0347985.1 methyltransferase domain-containing protein [Magnetococcales bacterium]MBF0631291.1 methyltransferase domain-containing protein [Magnetococcales bacterium]
MNFEATQLQSWYEEPGGRLVVRLVGEAMERLLKENPSERTLGLGFAQPYLDWLRPWTGHAMGAAPAEMGVVLKAPGTVNRTAQVRPDALPFPDAWFERVLMVHLLEGTSDPKSALRETWRILVPGGRLLILVANRGGLWARRDTTPFGWGRPYSPGQLRSILEESLLVPRQWSYALFFPPLKRKLSWHWASAWEKAGTRWFAPMGGVIICEAEKVVYASTPLVRKKNLIRHPARIPLPLAEKSILNR